MEEIHEEQNTKKILPFENLYLNAGFVSGQNDWWMYAVTVIFTVLCYLCAPLFTALHLLAKANQNGVTIAQLSKNPNSLFDYQVIGVDRNLVLISLLGIFVITFAGFYLAIRRIHQKNLLSLLTGYEKFRFKRFWFAFSVWALLLVFSVIGSYLFDPKSLSFNLNWQGFGISLLMMLLLMPIQTGFEEVFFRGYLVQGLSQVFKNGIVPVLITSVLFGAAHLSNPEVREYGWAMMLTYYIFFALFMGCLTLLDEGIELAFGIHFANNLVSSILVNSPNSVLKTYSIFDSKVENPSGEIILWFVMAIVTFVILRVKYKWKHFALIVK